MLERARVDPAGEDRLVRRWTVRHPADLPVLPVHVVPTESPRRRDPSVVLVERRFAEQHHELDGVECARPAVQVVVGKPATRERELFVEPSELRPEVAAA